MPATPPVLGVARTSRATALLNANFTNLQTFLASLVDRAPHPEDGIELTIDLNGHKLVDLNGSVEDDAIATLD
jgi:hypothetical protein